jgi:hypothetical protein
MDADREEPALREAFDRLRSETESGGVPDFRSMMARARAVARSESDAGPRPTRWPAVTSTRRAIRLGGWVTAAAAAVAAIVVWQRSPDANADFDRLVASYSADASSGAWSSPTAALLDVPGMTLTRTTPSIGQPLRAGSAGDGFGTSEGRDS